MYKQKILKKQKEFQENLSLAEFILMEIVQIQELLLEDTNSLAMEERVAFGG
tara:strand:- start:2 stop:157 length:156 start_codon:yes stop_codon:yes gene_type:complete